MQLSEYGQRIIEQYLAEVSASLPDVPAEERQAICDDLRAHIDQALQDSVEGEPTAEDVQRVLEALGEPEDYAGGAPTEPASPPPPAYVVPPREGGRGLAFGALVCALLSLVIVPLIPAAIWMAPLALAAIVLGIIALAKGRAGRGMAIAGLALGVVVSVFVLLITTRARMMLREAHSLAFEHMLDEGLREFYADNGCWPAKLSDLLPVEPPTYGVATDGKTTVPISPANWKGQYFVSPIPWKLPVDPMTGKADWKYYTSGPRTGSVESRARLPDP